MFWLSTYLRMGTGVVEGEMLGLGMSERVLMELLVYWKKLV